MATLKDTLKNSKSVKNSDEILDELFSSIKVCMYYVFIDVFHASMHSMLINLGGERFFWR